VASIAHSPRPAQPVVRSSFQQGENYMKKIVCKLMTAFVLALPLTAIAQSNDNMKQGQSQDQMKHDDMSQDQSKKDDMKNDEMKSDGMKKDKMKKDKKSKAKKDKMKKEDNMKHDDMKKDDGMKQN
jgi:pentapeptide MXKDX repeat protein